MVTRLREGIVIALEGAFSVATDRNHLIELRYQNVVHSLAALERLVQSLAGLPGRKAVLLVTDGVPGRPGDGPIDAYRQKYQFWLTNVQSNPAMLDSTVSAMVSTANFELNSGVVPVNVIGA